VKNDKSSVLVVDYGREWARLDRERQPDAFARRLQQARKRGPVRLAVAWADFTGVDAETAAEMLQAGWLAVHVPAAKDGSGHGSAADLGTRLFRALTPLVVGADRVYVTEGDGRVVAPNRWSEDSAALLIDYGNWASRIEAMQRAGDLPGCGVNYRRLRKRAATCGDPVLRLVVGDFRRIAAAEVTAMEEAGFTMVHCPSLATEGLDYVKDMADVTLTYVMNLLAGSVSPLGRLVLASSNRDFIWPLHALVNSGWRVSVMTPTIMQNPTLLVNGVSQVSYHLGKKDEFLIDLVRSGQWPLPDLDEGRRSYLAELHRIVGLLGNHGRLGVEGRTFPQLQDAVAEDLPAGDKASRRAAAKELLEILRHAGVLVRVRHGRKGHRYQLSTEHPLVRAACPDLTGAA
jgi:hypothetical protein